jgi:hypothetical protein
MYECGKLKKVIGNKILFRVILEQCEMPCVITWAQKKFSLQPQKRLLESKNTSRRPKRHEGVDLLRKVFNKSCSTTSKTP